MTSGSAKFAALDRAITREGTKIMWLVRVSGFPPFTWVNYAFGLTGIHLSPFLMTTFFGIIPGTIAFTYAGAAGAAALSGSGQPRAPDRDRGRSRPRQRCSSRGSRRRRSGGRGWRNGETLSGVESLRGL